MPERRFFVEIGQRFDRGVVIEPEIRIRGRGSKVSYRGARLLCDCGNEYAVRPDKLIRGHVRSCGCLQAEAAAQSGHRNRKHGLSRHPLYHTWRNMLERCENPACRKYPDYGGRGIRVCERWHDLQCFAEDIDRDLGSRPGGLTAGGTPEYTLDRIDNNGNYEPGNVRWATHLEQTHNRRPIRRS